MAKNKDGVNGVMEKLAMISDAIGNIFENGRSVVVFSLNENDFIYMKSQINNFTDQTQFKIDISGIEFIFLRDDLLSSSLNK